MEENFLKLCGVDALQTGKYITSQEDRDFLSVVPLPGVSREDALQRAAFHGADTFGVVPLKNGEWAIRVRSTQYESAAQKIRPDDFASIVGPIYELAGFPQYVCDEGVREFLGEANPLIQVRGSRKYGHGDGRRRKFLVKVSIPIVWSHK